MKIKRLIALLTFAAALTAGTVRAQNLPDWHYPVGDDPNDWVAVRFMTQTGDEAVAWYHRDGPSCRLTATATKPMAKLDLPEEAGKQATVDLFYVDQTVKTTEPLTDVNGKPVADSSGKPVNVTEFPNSVLSAYAATLTYAQIEDPATKDKWLKLKVSVKLRDPGPGVDFAQEGSIIPGDDPIYGDSRTNQQALWAVAPPFEAEEYKRTPFSSVLKITKECDQLEAQRYNAPGKPRDAKVFRTLLPMEMEISCAQLKDRTGREIKIRGEYSLDSPPPEGKTLEELFVAARATARPDYFFYANRLRKEFGKAAEEEYANKPDDGMRYPKEAFNTFESMFLSYRMQNFGKGRADFVATMLAAQKQGSEALQQFVNKWRAFVRSEIKDYIEVGSKQSRDPGFDYKAEIAKVKDRTKKAIEAIAKDDKKFLEELYGRAKMPVPWAEIVNAGELNKTDENKLSQGERFAYWNAKISLSSASLSILGVSLSYPEMNVTQWRAIIKEKDLFDKEMGAKDDPRIAQIAEAYKNEVEKPAITILNPANLNLAITAKYFTDLKTHESKIAALRQNLAEVKKTLQKEEEAKSRLTKAIEKLFPDPVESAAVEFMVGKDTDAQKTLMEAAEDRLLPKEKQLLIAGWHGEVMATVEPMLTGAQPQNPALAKFIQGKFKEEKLLGYYCPQLPKASFAGEEDPKKALDQAKTWLEKMIKAVEAPNSDESKKLLSGSTLRPNKPVLEKCHKYFASEIARKQQEELEKEEKEKAKKYSKIPNVIGPDQGKPDPKPEDPNANRDWIAGAKMGIWAGLIGFIFGGPVGMVLFGVAGVGLGWLMSKEINK